MPPFLWTTLSFSFYVNGMSNDSQDSVFFHQTHHVSQKPLQNLQTAIHPDVTYVVVTFPLTHKGKSHYTPVPKSYILMGEEGDS